MLREHLQAPELSQALDLVDVETWRNPGVVVRSVYEGQIRILDPITGKNYATEITPVVDVIIAGSMIKQVPIKILQKVEVKE